MGTGPQWLGAQHRMEAELFQRQGCFWRCREAEKEEKILYINLLPYICPRDSLQGRASIEPSQNPVDGSSGVVSCGDQPLEIQRTESGEK